MPSVSLFRALFVALCAMSMGGTSPALAQDASLDPEIRALASDLAQRIQISSAEKAWLAAEHTVRFRTAINPPYHFDLQSPKGISIDYARLACLAFGMRCTFVPMLGGSFAEGLGRIGASDGPDVFLSARRSPARERLALFTQPYVFSPQVIFTRENAGMYMGVDDLQHKTVLIEKGYLAGDKLRAVVPGISLKEYPSAPDVLKALASGTGDAYVGDLSTATFLIAQLGLSNLKVAAPTGFPIEGEGMMVRKDWPALQSLMDKSIAALTEREKQQLRNRWLSIKYEDGVSRNLAVIASLAALLLAALLAVYWRWNQRLQHEVAARQLAEQQLRVAATAFEAQEGMLVTDAGTRILRVNKAFTAITGYLAEDVVGKTPVVLRSGRHGPDFYSHMWDVLRSVGAWQGEIWNRRKDGAVYLQWLNITAVQDPHGMVSHYVGTMTDITQRKLAEEEIHALAFYDPLTGLPNRRLMMDRLRQALSASARHHKHGALMMLDLDNFKLLNDSRGHDVGDQLLVNVAQRLQSAVRESDTVTRLGGDEFLVILEDLDATGFAAMQAETVGMKILSSLHEPYQLQLREESQHVGSYTHHCSASIGISLFSGQQHSIDELLKRADTAMYQAKAAGRNTLRFFDPEMQATVTHRAAMEAELRLGIQQQELVVYYQMQVDASGQCVGVEALVRWNHPQRGLVLPGEFIGLAEETGLILPLGQWVLQQACRQLQLWAQSSATAHLTIAVNVSARQFRSPDFGERLLALIQGSGINAKRLKLELTESMLLQSADQIIEEMQALRKHGVGFALDDFGTGYSSLSYLKRLPIDQLKIDQSFVRDVLTDPNDASIAQTVINLAHSLDLAVIAEGVEAEGQRQFLAEHRCDLFQGYLFGRPVPIAELEAMLKKAEA